jgi:hypothetical protein
VQAQGCALVELRADTQRALDVATATLARSADGAAHVRAALAKVGEIEADVARLRSAAQLRAGRLDALESRLAARPADLGLGLALLQAMRRGVGVAGLAAVGLGAVGWGAVIGLWGTTLIVLRGASALVVGRPSGETARG